MDKKKYDIFAKVLERMHHEGILQHTVLVGSWCMLFYRDYFENKTILPAIRTRDMEFLFPLPFNLDHKTDLYELLEDIGFVLDYKGEEGFMIFQHPDLILEFLVPARGRESRNPYVIKQLGVNAQRLRFMDLLIDHSITTSFRKVQLRVPHPASFALHKLLIATRRRDRQKAEKDRMQATALLASLSECGEYNSAQSIFSALPKTWQKTISEELKAMAQDALLRGLGK